MSLGSDSWVFIIIDVVSVEAHVLYLALFKLISAKCRHARLYPSGTQSDQDQANHGERPGKEVGIPKHEILRSHKYEFVL